MRVTRTSVVSHVQVLCSPCTATCDSGGSETTTLLAKGARRFESYPCSSHRPHTAMLCVTTKQISSTRSVSHSLCSPTITDWDSLPRIESDVISRVA